MGQWYRYRLPRAVRRENLTDVDKKLWRLVDEVPGAFISGSDIWVGENGAWLIEAALNGSNFKYDVWKRPLELAGAPTIDDSREALYNAVEKTGRVKAGTVEWMFDHQVTGLSFGSTRDAILKMWKCGSGKTAAAAIWSVLNPPEKHTTVIVTPAAVRRQFAREIDRVTTTRARVMLPGDDWSVERLQEERRLGISHFVVATEGLQKHIDALEKLRPTNVIFDEIHRLRSKKRKKVIVSETGDKTFLDRNNIASAALRLSRTAKRRSGLTATFIANVMADAYAQLDLLEPSQWGKFWLQPEENEEEWRRTAGFAKKYCGGKPGQWGGIEAKDVTNLEEFLNRLSFLVHYVDAADVFKNLPPLRREVIYIDPAEQVKATGFEREIRESAAKGPAFFAEALRMEAAARKKKWIIERIRSDVEAGNKIVVTTGRIKDSQKLAAEIQKEWPEARVWETAGLDPSQREVMKDQYIAHRGGAAVLVGILHAWGTGVDGLQKGTSLAVAAMLPWTLDMIEQWEGRFQRPGQEGSCIVVYPIAEGTYDEKIARALLSKLSAVASVNKSDVAFSFGGDLKGNEKELLDSLTAKITQGGDVFDWGD